ncbi:MAG: UPF0182 family protein [Actinomycetota bacterium]|nr:UPF0182 family protein [Actinomycetota bacterium]
MRNSADLPRPSRKPSRFSDRGRALLIIAAVVVVGLLLSARFISSFYVDYLWHESVGRTDVFWGMLGAKATMFGLFAGTFIVLALLNLVIADRLAPTSFAANTHPVVERFHEFFGHRLRSLRFAVATVFGLLFAAPAISRWQDWLMFRNSKSFGISDPHFGNDVGFYMFKLPFITFVLDWLFLAVAFITVLVVATHVLSGGIVVQPPRPKVRKATKAHVAALLGLLAILKAGDYWVTRYELTTANRGAVRGITYTVDNAQLPAVVLLALVALLTAGLYLSTIKTDRWRPAVVASALWAVVALIGGVIYPSAVQSLVVNPNQKDKEAKYIAYNIEATRHALGIDEVETREVSFGDLSRSDITNNVEALKDVRLVKPDDQMVTRFQTDRGSTGQTINDLDPDRYVVDGAIRQVIVGARELDLDQVGNKSWQGTHLINTHGCGLVTSPAGQIESSGNPAYRDDIVDLDQPQLYFSPALSGYSIVGTTVRESQCPGVEPRTYDGDKGVVLDSTLRQLAFALDQWDYNLVGSSAIGDDSQMLMIRNPRERVQELAPFLAFDGDPYPVALDGRVVWVIDGYTTSSRYPYGQNADSSQLDNGAGLKFGLNYVRNSVKAVVDAYDGGVTLYVNDPSDPVLQVWRSAFPDLFTAGDEMPDGLVDHLRYPEELFRLQTAAFSKYRLDSADFFDREGAWSVALAAPEQPPVRGNVTTVTTAPVDTVAVEVDAGASSFPVEQKADRFVPYYAMFHPDGDEVAEFSLYRPFQPFSVKNDRREMVAYMTADSSGRLIAYTVGGTLPEGPNVVGANISTDQEFSATITVIGQVGSEVVYGDLQMIPIGDSLLWTRPVYVKSQTVGQPQVRLVVAYYNGEVGFGESLETALAQLFPGLSIDLGDVVGPPVGPEDPDDPSEPTDATASELLQQAEELFNEAEDALTAGDLGTYQTKIDEARALVAEALDLIET